MTKGTSGFYKAFRSKSRRRGKQVRATDTDQEEAEHLAPPLAQTVVKITTPPPQSSRRKSQHKARRVALASGGGSVKARRGMAAWVAVLGREKAARSWGSLSNAISTEGKS